MCVFESYAVVSGLRSGLAGGVGLPGKMRLNSAEAAAMLHGLSFGAKALVQARAGEESSRHLLWGWLYQHAAGQAVTEGWEIVRGLPRVGWLAEVVCEDLLRMDGKLASQRTVAMALKLPLRTYQRSLWGGRYRWLWGVGNEAENEAKRKLSREIYARE